MELKTGAEKQAFFSQMLSEFEKEVKVKELLGENYGYVGFGLLREQGESPRSFENKVYNFKTENCGFTVYTKGPLSQEVDVPREFRGYKIVYEVRTSFPSF